MTRSRWADDTGAALVTVLLIVAAMSAIAVALNHLTLSNARKAQALETQAQLRFYAVSGEELAEVRIGALVQQLGGALTRATPGLETPFTLPIEDAIFEITLEDASNCFNLNSLISSGPAAAEGGDEETSQSPANDFRKIAQAAGMVDAEIRELVAGVVDWIDQDLSSGLGGAEDGYYTQLDPPYRTSGLPLHNLSETRAIRGFGLDTITRLSPLICVLPPHATEVGRKLNINTLRVDQAELLVPVLSGALEIDAIRQLVAGRPFDGWADLDTFLADPALSAVRPDLIRQDRLGTVSSHVAISVRVGYRGQVMNLSYLYEMMPDRPVSLLRRERIG